MRVLIDGTEIQIQVLPNTKETQDETLDTFSFACVIGDKHDAYKPNTPISLIDDNDDVMLLTLVSDNVEIASFNPVKYLHSITAVQSTRDLSKQLLRNSVFSQPYAREKSSYNATTFTLWNDVIVGQRQDTAHFDYHPYILDNLGNLDLNERGNVLHLSNREKVSKTYIEIDVRAIRLERQAVSVARWTNGVWLKPKKWRDFSVDNNFLSSIPNSYTLAYTDENGIAQTENISYLDLVNTPYPSAVILNQKVECPKIQALVDRGCNDFYLMFPDDASDFLQGSCQPIWRNQEDDDGTLFLAMIIVHLKVVFDIYFNTAKDILDKINSRHKQVYYVKSFTQATPTMVQKHNDLWTYNSESLIDTLNEFYPPDLTFTQLTAYECASEVFSLLDSIFTFKINSFNNNALEIEYFNDWNVNKYEESELKLTAKNIAIGEDHFTNGLITYYQDGRAEVKTDWLPVRTREQDYGVPQDENAFSLNFPYPIQYPIKFEYCFQKPKMITNFYRSTATADIAEIDSNTVEDLDVEITFFLVESNVYGKLPISNDLLYVYDEPYTHYQQNTICYVEKSTEINVARDKYKIFGVVGNFVIWRALDDAYYRFFGLDRNTFSQFEPNINIQGFAWLNKFFRLHYISTVDGRTKIETLVNKYDGDSLVDQYNGAVDLNKMGVNLLGLSLKMGEPSLNISQKICKWEDRIKKGEIYKYDGAYWIANVCAYTILPNGLVKTNVSFVKNFNALSLNTRLLREKRLSTISSALTQKSEDNIVDYIYVSTKPIQDYPEPQPIVFSVDLINNLIEKTLWKNSTVDTKIKTAIFNNVNVLEYIYLPMHKYGSGNSICFEMSFNDPINAGNQMNIAQSSLYGADAYTAIPTIYTDENGFLDKCSIYFFSDGTLTRTQDYPLVDFNVTNAIAWLQDYEVYKQPNEIFALNYELCFLPVDIKNDFIGLAFINNNAFIDDDYSLNNEDIYFYYSTDDFTYSHLDRKAHGDRLVISNVIKNHSAYYGYVELEHEYISNHSSIKSWCIARSNGDILFASNNPLNNGYSVAINFYTRQKRI